MTTIGFAGLANSHPFTDARHLKALRPGIRFLAWDPSPQRRALFADEHPSAEHVESPAALLASGPDVVVLTRPPAEVAGIVAETLDAGSAVSITKPAVTCEAELRALEAAVAGREERVFTTSVLRFAPDLDALPARIRRVHVNVHHDIEYWLDSAQRWQDDAGGLVPMMGVHAFDMLERILGPTMCITSCEARQRLDLGLGSPDIAVGAATSADGVRATFEIDGAPGGQTYSIEVETDDGTVIRRTLGQVDDGDPFGFLRAARMVLTLADGHPSPVAWDDTRAVLQAVVEARKLTQGVRR